MECAIMCCTCHTLTRSREIVLVFPMVKILQGDGSKYFILGMGKFSYYHIVIDNHELLKYCVNVHDNIIINLKLLMICYKTKYRLCLCTCVLMLQ